MKNLIYKEMRLATPLLTYLFLAFTLMTFIPGYPILCGGFFVCFGIFQSYQFGREDNDILYSVLLPVAKKDVVKGRYIFACLVQMCGLALTGIFTFIRMTALAGVEPYASNVLMAANLTFLAFLLFIYTLFNCIFIGGFFKTAYAYGKPFIFFIIAAFLCVGAGEALHHFPGMGLWNDVTGEALVPQGILLTVAILIYGVGTWISCKISQKRFEVLDL